MDLTDCVLEESHDAYTRMKCGYYKQRANKIKQEDKKIERMNNMAMCCFGVPYDSLPKPSYLTGNNAGNQQ